MWADDEKLIINNLGPYGYSPLVAIVPFLSLWVSLSPLLLLHWS